MCRSACTAAKCALPPTGFAFRILYTAFVTSFRTYSGVESVSTDSILFTCSSADFLCSEKSIVILAALGSLRKRFPLPCLEPPFPCRPAAAVSSWSLRNLVLFPWRWLTCSSLHTYSKTQPHHIVLYAYCNRFELNSRSIPMPAMLNNQIFFSEPQCPRQMINLVVVPDTAGKHARTLCFPCYNWMINRSVLSVLGMFYDTSARVRKRTNPLSFSIWLCSNQSCSLPDKYHELSSI